MTEQKQIIDATIGAGAVTSPAWLEALNNAVQELVLVGGFILLILRIWIAIRELKNPPDNH